MKNNNKQFPKTLEAFEVEQGINTNFNLCIEIANRYNNHDKLIEALDTLLVQLSPMFNFDFGTAPDYVQQAKKLLESIEQQ